MSTKTQKIIKSAKKFVSDFWLGEIPDIETDELVGGFDLSKNGAFEGGYDKKVIELASARRAIGNFVSILTNQDIPVVFAEIGIAPGATDGKKVILSTSITKREDFDWGVGLALHEGSHIVLTDMNYFSTLWKKIPKPIIEAAEEKGIVRDQISMFTKFMFNYVEDRYIDTYVYDTAPGYRGYYTALYNKFFHSEEMTMALKSKGWRKPTLASYEMRIVNMTNPVSDPDALPALGEIFKMIDVKNIRRLKFTKDRFELSLEIVSKVLDQINKEDQTKQNSDNKKRGRGASGTINKIVDILDPEKNKDKSKADDVIGGDDGSSKDKDYTDDIGIHELSEKDLKKILKAIEKQRDFLLGKIDKKAITEEEKKLLEAIEEAGIHIVQIRNDLIGNGVPKVDCIIVKKLTKKLIDAGVIPMCSRGNRYYGNEASPEMVSTVNRGIMLGTMLGRKLMVRREENHTKFIRRREGKIDKRILAGIGAGLEDIFYHIKTDKYGKANLHITVDSSSSMSGMSKWGPTMICVVAICKAASMIPNLRVSVSFRASTSGSAGERPYVILAYDSEVDKFEKVKLLFPYLQPYGCTPEGLAMEATIKSFISKTLDGSEYFFLNMSDGEPYYNQSDVQYSGEIAIRHTKDVMQKLRRNGLRVLSYFISEGSDNCRDAFHRMYGADAKFINVTNVFDIARTMNEMFLKK